MMGKKMEPVAALGQNSVNSETMMSEMSTNSQSGSVVNELNELPSNTDRPLA